MSKHWLGVDTGGTFTDFVYFNGDSLRIHKVLSTPDAPERAILQGIKELDVPFEDLRIIHGSTVATNALLEAKGVRTAYIANKGFADILTIGRQARAELYNLMPAPRPALIPAEYCLEVDTRLSSTGELLRPLQADDIKHLIKRLKQIKPQAIAINLLFSFLDNRQEQAIKKQLEEHLGDCFICCASDVLPEYKEYERGMASALNAYVGPLMKGYLQRLANSISASKEIVANVSVLQSSGGTMDAGKAGEHAVTLLLSGPAGGLKGAQYIAQMAGESRLLSFDMGGTSTDVALMEGGIQLTSEASIGGYPVAVPMVDMHTIGAGGGSIAYVDAGGLLNVGPESAGASPGPACYAQGGEHPTVTDANLLLGRLRADGFLGRGMSLDTHAAETAMEKIARPLGLSVQAAAEGVVRIANEHMARALRTISVQRGFDPQQFTLTCFGGAGGLHVCALAESLKMKKAIVPVHAGVLSALGMLVSAPARELSHTCIQLLKQSDAEALRQMFVEMERRGVNDMQQELDAAPVLQRSVDLRYQGQSFTLNLPWTDVENVDVEKVGVDNVSRAFHELHRKTYGHQLDMPIELVNVRVSIQGQAPPFELPPVAALGDGEKGSERGSEKGNEEDGLQPAQVTCFGIDQAVSLYQREALLEGQIITGPALILETVSTTFVDQGWSCEVDGWGNLLLAFSGAC